MPELTLDGIRLERGGKTLCRDLSLQIIGGQCWGLLGANGAGKTTLLQALAGLLPLQAGRVLLDGQELGEYGNRERAQKLGLLFQEQEHGFPATVLEYVLQGRHPHISRWGWESAEDRELSLEALQAVGLEAMQGRDARQLSGGEQQRLAIATLINQAPQAYLLDEPSNHLDLHQQIRLLGLFRQQVEEQNRLVLMSLHDVNLALRYCDHFLLMLEGGECLSGTAAEVLTSENLTRLYAHPMLSVEGPHGPLFVPG